MVSTTRDAGFSGYQVIIFTFKLFRFESAQIAWSPELSLWPLRSSNRFLNLLVLLVFSARAKRSKIAWIQEGLCLRWSSSLLLAD